MICGLGFFLCSALLSFLDGFMSADQSQIVVECLRACVFLLGFANGLLFVGLFGRRWFF